MDKLEMVKKFEAWREKRRLLDYQFDSPETGREGERQQSLGGKAV